MGTLQVLRTGQTPLCPVRSLESFRHLEGMKVGFSTEPGPLPSGGTGTVWFGTG